MYWLTSIETEMHHHLSIVGTQNDLVLQTLFQDAHGLHRLKLTLLDVKVLGFMVEGLAILYKLVK